MTIFGSIIKEGYRVICFPSIWTERHTQRYRAEIYLVRLKATGTINWQEHFNGITRSWAWTSMSVENPYGPQSWGWGRLPRFHGLISTFSQWRSKQDPRVALTEWEEWSLNTPSIFSLTKAYCPAEKTLPEPYLAGGSWIRLPGQPPLALLAGLKGDNHIVNGEQDFRKTN